MRVRRKKCPHGSRIIRDCKVCIRQISSEAEKRYDVANRKKRAMATKIRRDNNPDYVLLRKYGITLAKKEAKLAAQGGHCAFCPRTEKLEIDHDHDTKRFRGILCDRHNRGLGFLYLRSVKTSCYLGRGKLKRRRKRKMVDLLFELLGFALSPAPVPPHPKAD